MRSSSDAQRAAARVLAECVRVCGGEPLDPPGRACVLDRSQVVTFLVPVLAPLLTADGDRPVRPRRARAQIADALRRNVGAAVLVEARALPAKRTLGWVAQRVAAADPDRRARSLHRQRSEPHLVDPVVLAVERERLAAPQTSDNGKPFIKLFG